MFTLPNEVDVFAFSSNNSSFHFLFNMENVWDTNKRNEKLRIKNLKKILKTSKQLVKCCYCFEFERVSLLRCNSCYIHIIFSVYTKKG